ncbi:PrsW family intramembrane metalloprotease [uncultured Nocardioides sp.]|uniref:PrsW family intramembrane metalloprotease n=1 Tax=uncultured Nocardioides sp. TaxID=198441 RepID=UPI0026314B14|nr:PrsW family intramembrane metalloprotease [uncultured Nocardioides sp.]
MSTVADTQAPRDPAGQEQMLEERRRAAIEESGWGSEFRFFQPRNACLWVYLLAVILGTRQLYHLAAPTVGVFEEANLAAVASAGLFCLAFLWFLHHADRYERTPARLAIAAFIGGGLAAPWAMALPGNAAMMDLYAKNFGQAWATDWEAGLTAPFVEESAKAIIFVLLLGLAPFVIRTVYDGLIVGAYVGLGFQVLEDMLYGQNAAYSHFGVDQIGAVMQTFLIRAGSGVASHAMYTAVFCAGIIYLLGTAAQPRRVGRGLALMAASMILHGVWDAQVALADSNPFLSLGFLLGITALLIYALFVALRWGSYRERGWMRDVLAPEVANGTITELELTALTGDRRNRRKDRKAAVTGRDEGMSKRREKHVLAGAIDLAHDLVDSRGHDTPAVEHSRAEIARLRTQTT